MSKGPWEKRVGHLLTPPGFAYSYKPVDSPMHGGAVRIDWLACDYRGEFYMIEVKQLPESRKSLNLENPGEMRPLQIEALNDAARGHQAHVILAVGRGKQLYLWGWRTVWAQYQWRKREAPLQRDTFKPELLPLSTAMEVLTYQTRIWPEYQPVILGYSDDLNPATDRSTASMLNGFAPGSSDPERSAWIMKQGDCTRTRAPMPKSERSSAKRGTKSSSSESSRTGGMKSSKMRTFVRSGRT